MLFPRLENLSVKDNKRVSEYRCLGVSARGYSEILIVLVVVLDRASGVLAVALAITSIERGPDGTYGTNRTYGSGLISPMCPISPIRDRGIARPPIGTGAMSTAVPLPYNS
jgi:hypothetical protein